MTHRMSIKQVSEGVAAWDAARKHPEVPAYTFEGDIVFACSPSNHSFDGKEPGLIEIKPKGGHEHE